MQRAQATHRYHDQDVVQLVERVGGTNRQDLRAERPAKGRQRAAEGECQHEEPLGTNADRFGNAPVIHRGAQACAEGRALDLQPHRGKKNDPGDDNRDPKCRNARDAEIRLPLQGHRNADVVRRWSEEELRGRHRDEDDADRKQHLIELVGAVEP